VTGSAGHPHAVAGHPQGVSGRKKSRQCELALEYLSLATEFSPAPDLERSRGNGIIKSHLFKLLYTCLQDEAVLDLRDRLQFAQDPQEHTAVVLELRERMCDSALCDEASSWYRRHPRPDAAEVAAEGGERALCCGSTS
jgi:hypothetical protein